MMTNPNEPASSFNRQPRRNLGGGGSPWRRIFCSLFLVAAAVALVAAFASSRAAGQRVELGAGGHRVGGNAVNIANKIAPEVLADTADGGLASVVILLADRADVSAGYGMANQDARGRFVYNTLTQHAARTQVGLQNFLRSRGVPYQSFWVVNMLVATADRALVEAVAARPDVARVDSNRPTRWIEDPSIANFDVTSSNPAVVEWGVQNVNAPAVWAMGFTGQGIVVGNQDTGMRWTHNALKPHYRGWDGQNADHNYNWHDSIHSGGGSCGPNNLAPCDDNGHGTHTTGTTVGDDGAGNQVGVAPGAKWIGCRNMDQGNGTPATYTECFQFFIAPTDLNGQNPNPDLRPHVMNNSWVCPASEGCTTRAELETIVNNTQAAGIFVEVSAGNSGPSCSTVSDPPAIYEASFSTGAIDITNTLAGFSSRGPSTYYDPAILKPNISAPGVNVRSSLRTSDSSYGNLSGTSMAGPHVVGVVALLWSARPQLQRDIANTKMILQNTANSNVTVSPPQTCNGIPNTQIPNNSFGYGRVDALAAVNSVPEGTPTPTPTGTPSPTPTATATATATPTPTATPTATPPPSPTPTPSETPTSTPTPAATPRATPRPRPTPHPRPTP
jgi:serine protease AprX